MSDFYNIYCRRGYGPILGQPGDPRSPPHNQGPPPGNMRSPPYGTPPGNQGYPPYQPLPMNQAGDRYQVMLSVLSR